MQSKVQLTSEQRRVLGVLLEKSLATPEYYPMTLNAVVAGCNQKNNREPVVIYSESDVGRVLYELMQMRLVVQAGAAPGARANRFEHRIHEEWNWNRRHRALMAELLLRGPQTVGELRAHSARMVPLPDLPSVASVLEELGNLDPPVVRVLPRQSGQSTIRYDHTLYTAEEAVGVMPPTVPLSGPAETSSDFSPTARLERLEVEVAELRTAVEELRQHLTGSGAGSP